MTSVRALTTVFAVAWRVSPGRLAATLALLMANGVASPLISLVLQQLTNAVIARDASVATGWAILVPVLALAMRTAGGLSTTFWHELAELQVIELDRELAVLTQGPASLETHETPDVADRVELLRSARQVLYQAVPTLLSGVTLCALLLVTAVLLARVEPLLLILPLFAVPALVAGRISERIKRPPGACRLDRGAPAGPPDGPGGRPGLGQRDPGVRAPAGAH
ncbi:MAG: transporter ATPase/permease [Acidimicrobiaceae bacterium]|nr:transporter ATPase/permease [Acidimicrobiaceae bacterium]